MDKRTQSEISGIDQRGRSLRNYLLATAGLILLLGCSSSEEKEHRRVLVSVYDRVLYVDELEGVVPEDSSPEDSISLVNSFINNWIREQVMLHTAENALSEDDMNVREKLESYRNSLIIYEFEKKWIKSRLDTTVSDQELRVYYDNNQEEFELDDYLVKAVFVKIPSQNRNIQQLETLYISRDSADLVQLEALCRTNAENFYVDPESWLYFDDILKLVPEEMIYNKEKFVLNRRNRRYDQNGYVFLLNVVDYRFGKSPFEFEKDNIKSRILQKRTSLLRRKLREDLLNKAYNNENIIRNEY